jgi:hypothetical protein
LAQASHESVVDPPWPRSSVGNSPLFIYRSNQRGASRECGPPRLQQCTPEWSPGASGLPQTSELTPANLQTWRRHGSWPPGTGTQERPQISTPSQSNLAHAPEYGSPRLTGRLGVKVPKIVRRAERWWSALVSSFDHNTRESCATQYYCDDSRHVLSFVSICFLVLATWSWLSLWHRSYVSCNRRCSLFPYFSFCKLSWSEQM